ncbi:unnamed protein product, partial [Brenthis ino]
MRIAIALLLVCAGACSLPAERSQGTVDDNYPNINFKIIDIFHEDSTSEETNESKMKNEKIVLPENLIRRIVITSSPEAKNDDQIFDDVVEYEFALLPRK